MLDLVVWVLWFTLGAYSFWFFFQAKTLEPLTLDELVILWKLHKQQTGCDTPLSKLEPILRKSSHENEFIGFRCPCGYQYLSKRPITQRVRAYTVSH